MALMRWTPMGHLPSFQHEMNRMVNEFFGDGNGEAAGSGLSSWTPAVDIHETEDGFVIKAELPGVSKDDVSIDVHQNTLTLRGQRKHEAEVQQDKIPPRGAGLRLLPAFVRPADCRSIRTRCRRPIRTACSSCTCRRARPPSRSASRSTASDPS